MSSDLRNYRAHKLMAMSARSIMQHLYPRLLAVHDLDNEIALPNAEGRIEMPSLMRDSYTFMEAHGVYLAGERLTSCTLVPSPNESSLQTTRM